MYKIINNSQRSFIVKASQVLKGGEKGAHALEVIIPASPKVVEVTTKLGKFLATYSGILVVEKIDQVEEVDEPLNVPIEVPPAEGVVESDADDPEAKTPKNAAKKAEAKKTKGHKK